jgi:hypothetical protein
MVNKTWLEREKVVMLFGQRNRWSLLHLYEQETELWDISNPNYSKKDAR